MCPIPIPLGIIKQRKVQRNLMDYLRLAMVEVCGPQCCVPSSGWLWTVSLSMLPWGSQPFTHISTILPPPRKRNAAGSPEHASAVSFLTLCFRTWGPLCQLDISELQGSCRVQSLSPWYWDMLIITDSGDWNNCSVFASCSYEFWRLNIEKL